MRGVPGIRAARVAQGEFSGAAEHAGFAVVSSSAPPHRPAKRIYNRPVDAPLRPPRIPSLFVTGTDTGVGKTVVAGAIADWFRRRGFRVAVLKPVATGCVRRREGLVSEDAEFLAACAAARHPLDLICPVRYSEPLAPAIAAERAGTPVDWAAVQRDRKS